MKTKTLFGLAALLVPALLLTARDKSALDVQSGLRDAPAETQLRESLSENRSGSSAKIPVPKTPPQDTGAVLSSPDNGAAEERTGFLNDVLPVIKRESRENDVQYRKRAVLDVENVIRKIARVSGRIACTDDRDFLRRGYLRLEWDYKDWKYKTLAHVTADKPVVVHHITMTPLDGDKTKMPGTKKEFLRLVSELTFLLVEDAGESADIGRPDFLAKLDDKPGETTFYGSSIATDYGPVDECGSIVLTWPNNARLKYFGCATDGTFRSK